MGHVIKALRQSWCDQIALQENQGKECTGTLYSGDHTGGARATGGGVDIYACTNTQIRFSDW